MEKIRATRRTGGAGDESGQDAARRSFERDKDELRHFGIPLPHREVHDGRGGGGRVDEITRRDFYLPY